MKLTIDSSEPLDRVLEVIGSLYGVELAVIGDRGRPEPPEHAATAKPRPSSARGAVRRERSAQPVNVAEVRAWARSNGHVVNDRGRLPATVVDAYLKRARSRGK